MSVESYLSVLFGVIIIGFLILDLGYFNKKSHRISPKEAAWQSAFWVVVSLGFSGLIYYFLGQNLAIEFLSAYVTEKMLSVDNLFFIMRIFSYFKLEEAYHHRALF